MSNFYDRLVEINSLMKRHHNMSLNEDIRNQRTGTALRANDLRKIYVAKQSGQLKNDNIVYFDEQNALNNGKLAKRYMESQLSKVAPSLYQTLLAPLAVYWNFLDKKSAESIAAQLVSMMKQDNIGLDKNTRVKSYTIAFIGDIEIKKVANANKPMSVEVELNATQEGFFADNQFNVLPLPAEKMEELKKEILEFKQTYGANGVLSVSDYAVFTSASRLRNDQELNLSFKDLARKRADTFTEYVKGILTEAGIGNIGMVAPNELDTSVSGTMGPIPPACQFKMKGNAVQYVNTDTAKGYKVMDDNNQYQGYVGLNLDTNKFETFDTKGVRVNVPVIYDLIKKYGTPLKTPQEYNQYKTFMFRLVLNGEIKAYEDIGDVDLKYQIKLELDKKGILERVADSIKLAMPTTANTPSFVVKIKPNRVFSCPRF